jgi:hypothetical protein
MTEIPVIFLEATEINVRANSATLHSFKLIQDSYSFLRMLL